MTTKTAATLRQNRALPRTPAAAGLPDPRPLTEYTAVYSESAGHSLVTVKLEQPCIIRLPAWDFVDVGDGSGVKASSVTVEGNDTIVFHFSEIISGNVCFIRPPYQDMQVQNFQGGYVRPGAQWFRKPG